VDEPSSPSTDDLADPVGPLEVGQHQDVEELGARNETEGIST
jgi:hypothetical protein